MVEAMKAPEVKAPEPVEEVEVKSSKPDETLEKLEAAAAELAGYKEKLVETELQLKLSQNESQRLEKELAQRVEEHDLERDKLQKELKTALVQGKESLDQAEAKWREELTGTESELEER